MKFKFIPKVIYVYIFVFFVLPGCEQLGEYDSGREDFTEDETPKDSKLIDDSSDNYFYFSYDDSASTAGVELIKDSLNDNRYPQISWARTWEFLNYENFPQEETEQNDIFSLNMGLWNIPNSDTYELGVYIKAPTISVEERQNTVLTILIDISGSMDDSIPFDSGEEGVVSLLDTVKLGMTYMMHSLKIGDVINVISFSTEAQTLLQSWEYHPDSETTFINMMNTLRTDGSTNIEEGINKAYEVANTTYDATKINRIILLTDAIANEGELDPTLISQNTSINYNQGIYFSGLGLGEFFNDAFLNELTEAGKGAYFAIVTPYDIRRAFYNRFISLLDVAAKDIQFRMDYPSGLTHTVSASEEHSTDPSEVERTNFSYNTSQFFLEEFEAENSELNLDDETFTLTIIYTDPVTQEVIEVVYTKTVSELLGNMENSIKDAFMVATLPRLIRQEITLDDAYKNSKRIGDYNSGLIEEYKGLILKWYLLHDYSPEE